jgi:hypothetical protein
MNIDFIEGFDFYPNASAPLGVASEWILASSGGSFPPTLVPGCFGGQAVNMPNTLSNFCQFRKQFAAARSQFSFGTAMFTSLNSGGTYNFQTHLSWGQDGVYQCGIRLDPLDFSVVAYRMTAGNAGTELGRSAANVWQPNDWFYLEGEGVIADANGRITCFANGSSNPILDISGSSVDTKGHPTLSTLNHFNFGGSATGTNTGWGFQFDDMFHTDTATRLGARRVEPLVVVSDGGVLTLVPSTGINHFAVVDEIPFNATDYLQGTNIGDLSQLNLADLSSNPAMIDFVNLVMASQKTDAASRSVAAGLKIGATSDDGPAFAQTASMARYTRPMPINPITGLPWSLADINAMQLYPKVIS